MSTKAVTTRIQHKHDLEANWLKAVNFVPMQGELIIYDAEVDANGQTLTLPTGRTTPYTYERFKIGDGKTVVSSLNFAVSSEADLRLVEDLYTYTNIGKITGASNTSPKKVASVGDSLKSVFNTVFGTQQDQQPTITTSNVALNVSAGTTSYKGTDTAGNTSTEYGAVVSATEVTITFTLANSGTANYGYRCGDNKTTGSQTFYYPVTKQSSADIKITLPYAISKVEDATVSSVAYKKLTTVNGNSDTITILTPAATYVSYSSKYLYCNFNSSKQVSIKVSLPAGSVTTIQQTRYEQISASVTLGAAQKENQLTAGTAITKFLTYLKNDATETNKLSGGTKSNTAGAYTIVAGSYLPYYLVSTANNLTTVTRGAKSFASIGTALSMTLMEEAYIGFLLPPGTSGSKTIYYEALGQWYEFDGGTTEPTNVSLTLNTGITATYQGYFTNKKAAAGTTKFKIE